MNPSDFLTRIAQLEKEISSLPPGSVSTKTVSGRQYYYHRWTENKRRIEKYIPAEDVDALQAHISPTFKLQNARKAWGKYKKLHSSVFIKLLEP